MKREVLEDSQASFEGLAHHDSEFGEFWLARDLQTPLGYTKWENFEGVVRRARQLAKNGLGVGRFDEAARIVAIGSGASRAVIDFRLDRSAVNLLGILATSFKLNGLYLGRNESAVLGLVAKWAGARGHRVVAQFEVNAFRFDLLIGNRVLVEFDEPHHRQSRQARIDVAKDRAARSDGFVVVRLDLDTDVVDAILLVEELLSASALETLENTSLAIQQARLMEASADFANEITNFNIKKDGLQSEPAITGEHVKSNRDVRDLLMERGIQPEALPASDDIKKIERRVQAETKKLLAKKAR